jgi:membrane protein
MTFLELARRTFRGAIADRLFGHAAELGFYFLFALFPTLFCAGSILGLMAQSSHQFFDKLLTYLSFVIPTSALGAVLKTFNETTAAASSSKLTFGTIATLWSASIGISALQDTLNGVFRLDDRRSYVVARMEAIVLTIALTILVGSALACMLTGDFFAALFGRIFGDPLISAATGITVRLIAWIASALLLSLSFAFIYYWAPNWVQRRWRWLTPGIVAGVSGWLMASFSLRIYLYFFNDYTVTYGSLGAVIILLTWFYLTGLMLLLGAEIDSILDNATAGLSPTPQGTIDPFIRL